MVPSGFKRFAHLTFIDKFSKVTLAGLNSLRQKEYQISVKNWIFDDPFHKKGPVLSKNWKNCRRRIWMVPYNMLM